MAKKHEVAHKSSSKEVEEGKIFAFLGVFLGIIGFVIVLLTKKDNKYAMFYAKQGLVLTIAYVIVWVVMIIPFIGWVIGMLASLLLLVLWILGWVYALSGKEKHIPLIGQFADKFNI
ncbi:TPA: DUF4870 domain-containing protein [Candidatus Woesearchaeota archaeon]|nr:DUF4870 domain-containing protein [Candidatus Woesearchaeota archaeon]